MGIRSCPAAELVFDGAVVPVANRLGEEGDGYRIALSALAEGRISIAAACVGLARSALEQAARYLAERRAFGGVLAEQQGLRFMIAEMARDVEAARALTRQAAAAKDRGEPIGEASSLAKWTASDTAMRVATDAVQLFGGVRLFARDGDRAADARREGRPDLRGHEPDPPPDRRRRGVQAGRPGLRRRAPRRELAASSPLVRRPLAAPLCPQSLPIPRLARIGRPTYVSPLPDENLAGVTTASDEDSCVALVGQPIGRPVGHSPGEELAGKRAR